MRLRLLVLVATAACAPEIIPGSYVCGPEQACPEGQACNGPDNICVLPSAVQPFACGDLTELEPNDAFASAQRLLGANTSCVTPTVEVIGCLQDADGDDWFQLASPGNCTRVGVEARIAFPVAFEGLALTLHDPTGAMVAAATACGPLDPEQGSADLCLDAAMTPGATYGLHVARSGEGTCGGQCTYNRYSLLLLLETP
jgi:hypothetical protein